MATALGIRRLGVAIGFIALVGALAAAVLAQRRAATGLDAYTTRPLGPGHVRVALLVPSGWCVEEKGSLTGPPANRPATIIAYPACRPYWMPYWLLPELGRDAASCIVVSVFVPSPTTPANLGRTTFHGDGWTIDGEGVKLTATLTALVNYVHPDRDYRAIPCHQILRSVRIL